MIRVKGLLERVESIASGYGTSYIVLSGCNFEGTDITVVKGVDMRFRMECTQSLIKCLVERECIGEKIELQCHIKCKYSVEREWVIIAETLIVPVELSRKNI